MSCREACSEFPERETKQMQQPPAGHLTGHKGTLEKGRIRHPTWVDHPSPAGRARYAVLVFVFSRRFRALELSAQFLTIRPLLGNNPGRFLFPGEALQIDVQTPRVVMEMHLDGGIRRPIVCLRFPLEVEEPSGPAHVGHVLVIAHLNDIKPVLRPDCVLISFPQDLILALYRSPDE